MFIQEPGVNVDKNNYPLEKRIKELESINRGLNKTIYELEEDIVSLWDKIRDLEFEVVPNE